MVDFIICSDGGSGPDGTGAAAAIVRLPGRPAKKLVALLGESSSYEAELAGGLLGLSWAVRQLELEQRDGSAVWFCDHLAICRKAAAITANSDPFSRVADPAGAELWNIFAGLSSRIPITARSPKFGEWLPKVMADHQRCDRVCRWIYSTGKMQLDQFGPGPIGMTAKHAPAAAWELSDLRSGAAAFNT